MIICPVCGRSFNDEESIAKHSLPCWKEANPNHKSTPAPHSADRVERTVNEGVMDFFASFKRN